MSTTLEERGIVRNAKIIHDIQDYHTPPAEVAEIATQANVKKLVLHHFAPPPNFQVVNVCSLTQKKNRGLVISPRLIPN